jgi:hypothetical protein
MYDTRTRNTSNFFGLTFFFVEYNITIRIFEFRFDCNNQRTFGDKLVKFSTNVRRNHTFALVPYMKFLYDNN